MTMRIGTHDITSGAAYIIAEAGVNHNGELPLAHRLVDVAADVGANAVKFQTWQTELICAPGARAAQYQHDADQYALLKRLELPLAWHPELRDHAIARGIDSLTTPDELVSARYLVDLGVPALKVGSAEVRNIAHLSAIGAFGIPVILSSGMATLEDVQRAVMAVEASGTQVAVLHCVSAYPAPADEMNLLAIRTLAAALDVPVGLSDHSQGNIAATTAVGIGIAILEKHITIDRRLPGPDHQASDEPAEFAALVRAVRSAERMLGTGVKQMTDSERDTHRAVRRVIVYARAIQAGTILTSGDVTARRTGADGFEAGDESRFVGRVLMHSVEQFQTLQESDYVA